MFRACQFTRYSDSRPPHREGPLLDSTLFQKRFASSSSSPSSPRSLQSESRPPTLVAKRAAPFGALIGILLQLAGPADDGGRSFSVPSDFKFIPIEDVVELVTKFASEEERWNSLGAGGKPAPKATLCVKSREGPKATPCVNAMLLCCACAKRRLATGKPDLSVCCLLRLVMAFSGKDVVSSRQLTACDDELEAVPCSKYPACDRLPPEDCRLWRSGGLEEDRLGLDAEEDRPTADEGPTVPTSRTLPASPSPPKPLPLAWPAPLENVPNPDGMPRAFEVANSFFETAFASSRDLVKPSGFL